MLEANLTESRITWEMGLWACLRGTDLILLIDMGKSFLVVGGTCAI